VKRGQLPLEPVYTEDDVGEKLEGLINDVVSRRGKIVVRSFAVGRTQRVHYVLHSLVRDRRVPSVPVFVDRPTPRSRDDLRGRCEEDDAPSETKHRFPRRARSVRARFFS